MTDGPVDLTDFRNWWAWTPGACWRHPEGPRSSIEGRESHPVVQVAFEDAAAYAAWAGKELPSEAEWEYAARGGLDGAEFAWGDEFAPGREHRANTWQGSFPWRNSEDDGFAGTCPVRSFPPNGYGLFEVCGNVWEWTTDWYVAAHVPANPEKPSCCAIDNPRGPALEASFDPRQPGVCIPRRVVKGGSYLCAPSYCRRYRPAARHAQMVDSGMSHIGFRCIRRRIRIETSPECGDVSRPQAAGEPQLICSARLSAAARSALLSALPCSQPRPLRDISRACRAREIPS